MHKLNGHKPLTKAADVTATMDDGATVEKLMRKFYPLIIESAFLDASLAGVPVAFDLENEHVQTVLDRLAMQIRGVAETTRDDVRRLVGQQAKNGWTTAELAKHIREMGEINSASRSTMIARTELAAGYSQGSLAAYRASGVVDRKEWLLGPEPCELCAPLGGTIVGLDEEFADGIDAPPAHPNCTCAVSPLVSED